MRELTAKTVENFKVNGFPHIANSTLVSYMAIVRCFLADAYRLPTIAEPLVSKLKKLKVTTKPGEPYSDAETKLIL